MTNHAVDRQDDLRFAIKPRRRFPAETACRALRLAAAPVFAAMALLTGPFGADMPTCMGGSPLDDMAAMYALMSVFHAGPWLKRAAGL